VDENFFNNNIINAFKLRKDHEMTKKRSKFDISAVMLQLIKNSN
jgi:hypothetical protein